MNAAFGASRLPPPELFLIALATLELLSEVAARTFAARAAELPGTTCTLLRIAATDSGCDLAMIMRAAELTDGMQPAVGDLVPAMRAHLIEVDGTTARFRHPLVRSAVYQAASLAERHAAHAALAEVLADDPDRRVWHRAAAAVGRDPAVASELEETARRARSRGGLITAATVPISPWLCRRPRSRHGSRRRLLSRHGRQPP